MEKTDSHLLGHLVLYHIVNDQDKQQNIQLWHSDYSTNGSAAIVNVRLSAYKAEYKFSPMLPAKTAVSENEYHICIPSKWTLLKWGHFDRAKSILKVLLVSWTELMSTEEI